MPQPYQSSHIFYCVKIAALGVFDIKMKLNKRVLDWHTHCTAEMEIKQW